MPPLGAPDPAYARALAAVRAARGRGYWQALDQLVAHAAFRAEIAAAFPALSRAGPGLARRDVLKCLGGALALAGVTGCERQPDERALPYVVEPEGVTPGLDRFYATAFDYGGVAQPILGRTTTGRPTKIEGNPDHPASGGAADAITQASLLGLYDPDRSDRPLERGRVASWAAWDRAAATLRDSLDHDRGAGLRLLTGPVGSPLLHEQIATLLTRWPAARWHRQPRPGDRLAEATTAAFGRPLERRLHLEQVEVLVALDDDLLGPGPRQTWHARAWSAARQRFQAGGAEVPLFVAEPAPTLTGSVSRDRLAADERRIPTLLAAIAAALDGDAAYAAPLNSRERAWVARAAAALDRHRGRGLLSVGTGQPPAVQALGWTINARLGNLGRSLIFTDTGAPAAAGLAELASDIAAGRVTTLIMLDTNPAHDAPGGGFAALLDRVPMRVHAGLHVDETGRRSHWHLPIAHALEDWSDGRAADGSAVLVQPLVRPFLGVRSRHALLAELAGGTGDARAVLRASWRRRWGLAGAAFEQRWREALVVGRVADSELAAVEVAAPPAPPHPPVRDDEGLRLVVRADPCIWDSSLAANPWLQECPKPLSKLTWGNAVHLAPATAEALGVGDGDMLRLAANGGVVEGPVVVIPGQARRTVLVHLGHGRTAGGRVAEGVGFNAAPLVGPDDAVTITPLGKRATLARSQHRFGEAGHDFVRAAPSPAQPLAPPPERPNAFRDLAETPGPQWGMAIDLDLCIGCNACVVACVAENNIPMVGRDEVSKGREMHWLRVDRYASGSGDDAEHVFQPVPCMHCEDAPCEMGCPVNAAVHSPDGLNLQVYNRCIGTRTCSAYCPYKVRRFNWFDYTEEDGPELRAARNPDVTVRGRGVMEKCTYCIQRIERARIDAKVAETAIPTDAVKTACQQTCPTDAIVFGDLADPDSAVSRLKRSGRNYSLLEEANTRPRTTYLARIDGRKGAT